MNFKQAIKDAWHIVKFDEHAIKRIAHEKDVLKNGIFITVVAGIAAALGKASIGGIIGMPIGMLVGSLIGFGILHLIAKAFGGKGTFKHFFSVGLHTGLLGWILIVPFVGMMLGVIAKIWGLVAMYFVIKNVHGLSPTRSIIVLLIPIVIAMIIAAIVAAVLAVAFFNMFSTGLLNNVRLF